MTISILNRYTAAVLATFAGSTLAGLDFGGLNLTNADFSGHDLTGTIFKGCVSPGSTFQNATLIGTKFFRGNVEGSDFRGATWDVTTDFSCCYFEDVLLDPPHDDITTWVLPFFYGGQSNCVCNIVGASPVPLPNAAIRFFYDNSPFGGNSGGVWGDLCVDAVSGIHGAEIMFATTLALAGFTAPVCKIARGATTMFDWSYGSASQWTTQLQPSMLQAAAGLNGQFPGRFFRWLGCWYLGEDDSRSNGNGATTYGTNFLSFLSGLSGLVGQNLWKRFTLVQTQSWLGNAIPNALHDCRYWERIFSFNLAPLNVDGSAHQGDNVHLTAAAQDDLGQNIWAPAAQLLIAAETP